MIKVEGALFPVNSGGLQCQIALCMCIRQIYSELHRIRSKGVQNIENRGDVRFLRHFTLRKCQLGTIAVFTEHYWQIFPFFTSRKKLPNFPYWKITKVGCKRYQVRYFSWEGSCTQLAVFKKKYFCGYFSTTWRGSTWRCPPSPTLSWRTERMRPRGTSS